MGAGILGRGPPPNTHTHHTTPQAEKEKTSLKTWGSEMFALDKEGPRTWGSQMSLLSELQPQASEQVIMTKTPVPTLEHALILLPLCQ